ncbi:MAG: penicillin-binding transpeptidase domain-containing protein [Bacteroidota bacterium]
MSINFKGRQRYIQIFFLAAGVFLISKAMHLQLIDTTFRNKADAVGLDKLTVYPSRGVIYDRDTTLMVVNEPIYELMVTYNQIDPKMDTSKFCDLLGIDKQYFSKALNKDWRSGRYSKSVPFVFISKVTAERFATFQESLYQFPGFFTQLRNVRGYPGQAGAHVLGYIREVNSREVDRSDGVYVPGDYIGSSGLESSYEQFLRGEKGAEYVFKDNLGRIVDSYKSEKLNVDPESGRDLISSIDIDLQALGEKLMNNKRGSVIAIEPKSGEILALISSPTYDPNKLVIGNEDRGRAYLELTRDSINKPLLNRAVTAQYPPGSLFKSLIALVGMQKGVLAPDRTIRCAGAYVHNGMVLTGCHGHPTCTSVSMALQHSCNAYFVTVFRDIVDQYGFNQPEVGLDTLNAYLKKFGLGEPLGIDFPSEKKGNYPTSEYYTNWFNKQQEGQRWNSLWIRSLGIGQGEIQMTTVQMANTAAMLANKGYYIRPHLVKGYLNSDTPIPANYRTKKYVGIDSVYFEPVIDGMYKAVLAGTATSAYVPGLDICGKTGTAENSAGEDHSVFFAFAPKDNPQIAIAVFIENAGFGGTWAAPLAGLMIEQYINGEIAANRKWTLDRILNANLIKLP